MFQKEYKLSDEQREATKEISKDTTIEENPDWKDTEAKTAKDMKDMFGEENRGTYVNLLASENYIKYIDVNTLQA